MALLTTEKNQLSTRFRAAVVSRRLPLRAFFWSFLLLVFLGGGASSVQGQSRSEYRVKAVFLFNFAQFVTWPESAFSSSQAPFVIGVLGRDPFGPALDATVQGEQVGGRRLEVRRYRSLAEVKDCHILFISNSEQARMTQILDGLAGRPILTVGETDRFAMDGGMIRFISENNKIRFRINQEEAERSKLSISSKLLRLSEIVKTERVRR